MKLSVINPPDTTPAPEPKIEFYMDSCNGHPRVRAITPDGEHWNICSFTLTLDESNKAVMYLYYGLPKQYFSVNDSGDIKCV